MKKSILALALLASTGAAAGFSTAASAAIGNPFLKNYGTPQHIADALEASLPRDKSGNGRALIDPKLCHTNGSCATAENFLDQLQFADPGGAPQTVQELPAYLRSLVVVDTNPDDVYSMSYLVPDGYGGWSPAHGDANHKDLTRHFKPGEKAYMNPKTGKIVLAGDCSNPIEFKVDDCLYIDLGVDQGQELHGFRLNQSSPRDKCGPLLLLAGATGYVMPTDDCPRANCTAVRPAQFLGGVPIEDGETFSFRAPVTGRYILRVSKQDLGTKGIWLFCLYDPRTGVQSFGETVFSSNWKAPIGQSGIVPTLSYRIDHVYISHLGKTSKEATVAWFAKGGKERIWTDYKTGQKF